MEWIALIVLAVFVGMDSAYSNSSFCRNIRVILYGEMGSNRCIKRIC